MSELHQMDLGALKENIFKIFYYVLKTSSRTWRWYGEMHEWFQLNAINIMKLERAC